MNKSLLHYYYRSKEKLFDAVFIDAISHAIPKIGKMMSIRQTVDRKDRFFYRALY